MVKPNFDLGPIGDKIMEAKQKFVGSILVKRALLTPDRMALQWNDRRWTYKELNEEVNKLANSLTKIGVKRGERICMMVKNRGECAHILYAAAKIGAIVAFLNWRNTERELREAIEVVTSDTIMVAGDFNEKLRSILGEMPFVKRVVYMDEMGVVDQDIPTYSFWQLIAEGEASEPQVELNEEDALYIVYTSGTTGVPKGATISHRAEIQRVKSWMANYCLQLGQTPDDSCIIRGPFFHVTSIAETFSTHALGGKAIIVDGYPVKEMVDLLEQEQISWLSLSPGMYERFIDEIRSRGENFKIKGIRAIGSMADITPDEQIRELTMITGAPFFNTYGLTEIGIENFCNNCLPVSKPEDDLSIYAYKGKAENFDPEIRLLNSEGKEVAIGEPGELVIRTPMMFSGYWNNPETNARDFHDGWFHTGDVLRRNPDGLFEFVSRVKYMIKTGAENVYPAEIERVIYSHPQVRECCVVGAPHPKWGETPVAFVAVSGDATPEDLRQYCRANLATFKVPNLFAIVQEEDFPRNQTGKVLREQVEAEWLPKYKDQII